MKQFLLSVTLISIIIVTISGKFLYCEEQKWDNIIYIFDASGSMFGKLGDEVKISVAKRVLTNLINDLPDTVNLGLMYFGNKIKGRDCVRFPVKIQLGAKDKVIKEIQALDPGGLTPLAGSLEIAGDYLIKSKLGATIVLITDGKEECGGDPLKAAKKLHEIGINVNYAKSRKKNVSKN